MFVTIRRRRHGERSYEYVDIVENHKVQGKIRRTTLGTLGRRDQLAPQKIDGLIEHLRKLASPEGRRGVRLGEMQIKACRELGVVLAVRQLWTELGLDQLLAGVPQSKGAPVAEAGGHVQASLAQLELEGLGHQVSQEVDEDVGLHPTLGPVEDGPDLDQGLEDPEGALDLLQLHKTSQYFGYLADDGGL